MDGLFFAAPDYSAVAMVTTEALVENWLRENKWGGSKAAAAPKDIVSALNKKPYFTMQSI